MSVMASKKKQAEANLSMNHLATVLTELFTVRDKWYYIGLQLRVSVADLQRIESEYKNDHTTCLRQMLIRWLETETGSWRFLCDALQSPLVLGPDDKAFVTNLMKKYCEEPESKAKKRKILNPSPSGQEAPATPPVKKPRGDIPDTLDPYNFVKAPSHDRLCLKCHQVPIDPLLLLCCNAVFCQPCSETKRYCVTHHCATSFSDDKKLRNNILKLHSKCPNWRSGCQFKDTVAKVYRQHLPECQPGKGQSTPAGGSIATTGKLPTTQSLPASPATPVSLSATPVSRTEVMGSGSASSGKVSSATASGPSKVSATSPTLPTGVLKFPVKSEYSSKQSKPKMEPAQVFKCKYQRIGCQKLFLSQPMLEGHLKTDTQMHLDLAIGKIEQILDILHRPQISAKQY